MRMPLAGFVLCALASAATAQERSGDVVPFDLRSSVIFVKGSIGDVDDLNFIVDTGASVTVVKPATARKLGLVKQGDRLGGLLAAPTFKTVESIGSGKAIVRDLPVAVMNVPQADLPLFLQGISYDGILGYNYLSQFVVTIDYKKRTLRLEPNDYTPEDPREALKLPFGRREEPKKAEPPSPPPPAVHVGISYATLGDDVANEIGLDGGVVVRGVAPDSPAARAGLRKGDILQEIDGRRVRRAQDYQKILATLKPDEDVTFGLVRDRKDLELTVTPTERN